MTPFDFKGQLCVVTGAGGFIGSHLVETLLAAQANVRALVHYNALGSIGHLRELDPQFIKSGRLTIVAGDVRDSRCMRTLVQGANCVFHLAALIGIPYSYAAPESYLDTNARGTLNLLEACRDAGVARILHTSTSEVYGTARQTPINERHLLQAQSPYSASKIAADKLAESYALSFGLPVTTVRPFNTYGPRQSCRAIIPTILSQALSSACAEIRVGSLDTVRDFTFVEDTARAFCEIAQAPLETVAGRLYNLGAGQSVSIEQLVGLAQEIATSNKPVIVEDKRLRPTASEVQVLLSDPSRIEREVGWKAQVSLEEGLKRTAEYLRRNPPENSQIGEYVV